VRCALPLDGRYDRSPDGQRLPTMEIEDRVEGSSNADAAAAAGATGVVARV